MERFVLTANDNDSILAGKIFIRKNPSTVHLAAGRKGSELPFTSILVFVRPYLNIKAFLGDYGYCANYKVIIFHYKDSELYNDRELLENAGCECIWVEPEDALCTAMWSYLYNNKEYPAIVKFTKDYMKWELLHSESMLINYGLSIIPNKLTQDVTELYLQLLNGSAGMLDRLIVDGANIMDYLEDVWKFLAKELVFTTDLHEFSILAANIPGVNSRFFIYYNYVTDYDLNMIFHTTVDQTVRHTLYRTNPEIDVGLLARAFDGNGSHTVGSFVGNELAVICERGPLVECDYNLLLGSKELLESVVQYIRLNIWVKPYEARSGHYRGLKAYIANTPYLTHTNMFSLLTPSFGETFGVLWCMQANGMYRITCVNLDDTDPGESFGTLYGGKYRISIAAELPDMN